MRRAAAGLALAASAVFAFEGCGIVDLGSPPSDINACRPSPSFFASTVWPNYLEQPYGGKTCKDSGCHDAGSFRELVITPPTSAATIPLPTDWQALYMSVTEEMECTDALDSPLYTKPAGLVSHGGGMLFDSHDGTGQAIATILEMWVAAP